ncbi:MULTISPECIES: TetR/AcrR family transcriptional regulator [Protofrankia]|uniref:TetR family transcriptional regulator n=1 Tax=Protofrankia coriariae TaxID=1562887 RepID=A0ABR5F3H4_9ACTN|nr:MULTISPECIES: TetR family transcriptional regulator [Protofrankia]KLL11195.1 TetR family transcriptional regulator [Protofrankia coriariae]ONH35924.1 TetR family transcriptional regulator [Protofrankia sp. BMG5.30]
MARPKVPLISRQRALEVALEIIDTEGIDSLSIRRLAERLRVNGASLYHHFQNKDEIVVGAAKLALEGVRTPQAHDEPWRAWILRSARRLRQALREHPDLVPVMLRRQPLSIGFMQLEATAALLAEEGVPVGAIAPMLEALELAAIGSALHEARGGDDRAGVDHDAERTPYLSQAFEQRSLSADEIFDRLCGQLVDTVVATAAERAAGTPATRALPPPQRRARSPQSSSAKATA